jgi:hypothetical protein
MDDGQIDRHAADDRLFAGCMEEARKSGVIEYRGEYGAEIIGFVPFVNWLNTHGHLGSIRILTYRGMRPYYFFLDDSQIEFKDKQRKWCPPPLRKWPANETGSDLHQSKYHLPPDYRTRYRNTIANFPKPVLFVQNKFGVEWSDGPINYFPLTFLRSVFTRLKDRFTIIYSRPRNVLDPQQYSHDHNRVCDYPDFPLAAGFEEVILFEALEKPGLTYNDLKLAVLAKSYLFLAVQGGGTHLISYFGNSVLFVLHMWGPEYPDEYRRGRYKRLSDPPPEIYVVNNWKDLQGALTLFEDVDFSNGGARAGARAQALLKPFRM